MIILNIFLLLEYLFLEISSNFLFCSKQCWNIWTWLQVMFF